MTREGLKNRWVFLAVVAAAGFAVDFLTKQWAVRSLAYGRPVSIIGEFVEFALIYNRAALFGLDPRRVVPWLPLNKIFFVFSVFAMGAVFFYYRLISGSDRLTRWGLALILPGAMGNLFDRIIHPGRGVVDFIKIGISREMYWPIFNMADVYLTVGVCLILFTMIREETGRAGRKQKQEIQSQKPEVSSREPGTRDPS